MLIPGQVFLCSCLAYYHCFTTNIAKETSEADEENREQKRANTNHNNELAREKPQQSILHESPPKNEDNEARKQNPFFKYD